MHHAPAYACSMLYSAACALQLAWKIRISCMTSMPSLCTLQAEVQVGAVARCATQLQKSSSTEVQAKARQAAKKFSWAIYLLRTRPAVFLAFRKRKISGNCESYWWKDFWRTRKPREATQTVDHGVSITIDVGSRAIS